MPTALIPNGYILISRQLLNSDLQHKPLLFRVMWQWMLLQASHKDHNGLRRGQFFTSIERMRDAFSYKVGYRTVRPTVREVRCAYDFLTKGSRISITKVTHGMIVTIINYDYYQTFLNYEGHSEEPHEMSTCGTILTRNGTINGLALAIASENSETEKPETRQEPDDEFPFYMDMPSQIENPVRPTDADQYDDNEAKCHHCRYFKEDPVTCEGRYTKDNGERSLRCSTGSEWKMKRPEVMQ